MPAFGIGTNTQITNSGEIKGTRQEIACACWFTSLGNSTPIMIKYKADNGELLTIDKIHVRTVESKNYSGIQSIEYRCSIISQDQMREVKLIFFKEDCKWIMVFI